MCVHESLSLAHACGFGALVFAARITVDDCDTSVLTKIYRDIDADGCVLIAAQFFAWHSLTANSCAPLCAGWWLLQRQLNHSARISHVD